MIHELIKYSLPAALVFGLVGFFGGSATQHTAPAKVGSPRSVFLSNTDEPFDYDRLAQVCLTAARRTTGPLVSSSADSPIEEAGSKTRTTIVESDTQQVKQTLDHVMAVSLERGTWSRAAGMQARLLLKRLPESDVVDFENLMKTVFERGDLRVDPGAWVPNG